MDSLSGRILPKIRIISKNSSNKSLWALNFIQKSQWAHSEMIEILTKIRVKITIIVVEKTENWEPYYFIIFCKCEEVPLFLVSYQKLASTLTTDEQSSYSKVYTKFAWKHTNDSNTWFSEWPCRLGSYCSLVFVQIGAKCEPIPFCWDLVANKCEKWEQWTIPKSHLVYYKSGRILRQWTIGICTIL